MKGLYKLMKWIENRGLKRAAVTNAPKPNAELMISKLGLKDFFDVVILGSDCEHAKPYPDPYLKALEVLKVSKDHTFVCEVFLVPPSPPNSFYLKKSLVELYFESLIWFFDCPGLHIGDKSRGCCRDACCGVNYQKP